MKKFKSVFILTFLVVALLGLIACQKQSVPSIEKDFKTAEEERRLLNCSEVDLTQNILEHYNTQLLFTCMRWDKEFPALYQAITQIGKANWNHLMMPLNDAYLKNPAQKEKFFKNIRALDSRGGLDDLSFVITALTETNFFDATKLLFECVNDPSVNGCHSRKGQIPSRAELSKIIELIKIDPKAVSYGSNLIKNLIYAIKDHKEEFRTEVLKFKKIDKYIDLRLKLVDALANKSIEGLSSEDRLFLTKILLTGNEAGTEPWLYSWLHSPKLTKDLFISLIKYPGVTNPEALSDLRGVGRIYDQGLLCTFPSGELSNEITLNAPERINVYANLLLKKDQQDFFEYATKDLTILKLAAPACVELEKNEWNVNYLNVLTKVSQFLSEKEYFDFIKFLVQSTTVKFDPGKKASENLYLLDFFSRPIVGEANNLNAFWAKNNPDFFPIFYSVIYGLDKQAYIDLGKFSEIVLKEDNDSSMKGLGLLWNFYSPEEKNFIFNFIDRHFENETNYVLLFDFYTKLIDDSVSILPDLKNAWAQDDRALEQSYLTLEDVLSKFDGKDTLRDFKKFFSRDQILKVLEILSSGVEINLAAKRDLDYMYSDNYVTAVRGERYKFDILRFRAKNASADISKMIQCMEEFNIKGDFYTLVRALPSQCKGLEKSNFGIQIYTWLNEFDRSFMIDNPRKGNIASVMDKEGLFSPLMLNTNIALLKVIDTGLAYRDASKSGLNYLLDKADYYLYKFDSKVKGVDLVYYNMLWLSDFDKEYKSDFEFYRSSIVKDWTAPDTFNKTRPYLIQTNDLLKRYADWLKNDNYLKSKNKTYGKFNSTLVCEKFLDTLSGPYNCPNVVQVKKHVKNIVTNLTRIWEKDQASPIYYMLKAFKNLGGLLVPFESKNQKTYYLTIKESMESIYDMSDKTYDVNRIQVNLVNAKNQKIKPVMTTLERIESVIREVSFGYNYLGVAFLNWVAAADDYNKEVKARKFLLSSCLKIPVIRCGKKMSDDELRMGRNSLEVYDGLLDANNGRGLGSALHYGKFLQTFEQSFIASSAKVAQKRQLFLLPEEALKKHNAVILGDISMLAGMSHLGRFMRDRIGMKKSDITAFVNRQDFKMVEAAIFRGFELESTGKIADSFLKKLMQKNPNDSQVMLETFIDWLNSLSYDEQRRFEETTTKLLVIGSYLGDAGQVYGATAESLLESTANYKENNLFNLFKLLDRVLDKWPVIKMAFPSDAKFIDVLKEISPLIDFLHEELMKEQSTKNLAYRFVNDTYNILDSLLFAKRTQLNYGFNQLNYTGSDLLISLLSKENILKKFFTVVRQDASFLEKIQADSGTERIKILSDDFNTVLKSDKFDGGPYRLYLENTSRPLACFANTKNCAYNYHFDEPMKLVRYLSESNTSKNPRFYELTAKVFKEERQNFDDFISDVFPCIMLK